MTTGLKGALAFRQYVSLDTMVRQDRIQPTTSTALLTKSCCDLQKDMDFGAKANVLGLLEEAAAALNGSAGEDLGDAFKRYRQAVFKLNYKINKLNTGKKNGAKVHAGLEVLRSPICDRLPCDECFQ